MVSRISAGLLALLVLVVLALACTPGSELPAPRNLLLVTLDTTRADFVSGLGGPPGVTPNLALLASVSAVFTGARSDSNVTNPSHVSILSGVPLGAHGVANNRTALPASVDTLPEAFARAGFATAGFVGAAHVGPRLGWRGFDRLEGPKHRATAEQVTDLAIAWLREREPQDRPFFLWVHCFDPHMVYSAQAKTIRRFYDGDPRAGEGPPIRETPAFRAGAPRREIARWLGDARDRDWPRALYAAALHETDAALARLLRAIPAEDTAIVITADHGESLGEHRIFYDHVGLFETQLRVPLLIRVPGLPPRRSDLPVSTLDLAPTVAELFGLELGNDVAGLSLVSALVGAPDDALRARQTFVAEHAHRQALAIRDGEWKLVWQRRSVPPLAPGVSLFHLPTDPGEARDVAARHPERVAALLAKLEAVAGRDAPALPEQELSDEAREQLRALGYAEP